MKILFVIQKQMQLNRPVGPAKLRPVKKTCTQIHHRRVKTHQLVFESKLGFSQKLPPASAQKIIKDILEQFPLVFIGIGQGRALRALEDPKVIQFPKTTGQTITNLPQRMGLAQLAEARHNGTNWKNPWPQTRRRSAYIYSCSCSDLLGIDLKQIHCIPVGAFLEFILDSSDI